MRKLTQTLTRFFGSRRFFYIVMGFFLFEALWLVFTAIYPMAFDEDFHFGLIKLYAHHWTPFLTEQPVGAEKYGAVVHDPSYLYHYLMSFPYRIVAFFTDSETKQVIALRLLNVAMFTYALVLYRKVMLRAKASAALANITLAIFVLIPIVPFLAAHVNYDNVFMILVPLLCLTGFAVIEGLQQKRIDLRAILAFAILCMLTSLVKYAALPVALAGVVFLLVVLVRAYRRRFKSLWPDIKAGFGGLTTSAKYVWLGLFLLSAVLFIQRYGVNLALYKTPVPDCGQILTVDQCNAYGPWARDHGYAQQVPDDFKPNPVTFMGSWLHGMWHRLFFAINSVKYYYINYLELPIPSHTASVLAIVGLLAWVVWWRAVFRGNILLAFATTMALGYLLVLWLNGYEDYSKLGRAVAINGRYLLPIFPLLAIGMGKAIGLTLQKFKVQQAKPYLATIAILLFLYGGGVFTFILRSDATWDWPNQTVIHANNAVRKVLAPIIYEGPKQ